MSSELLSRTMESLSKEVIQTYPQAFNDSVKIKDKMKTDLKYAVAFIRPKEEQFTTVHDFLDRASQLVDETKSLSVQSAFGWSSRKISSRPTQRNLKMVAALDKIPNLQISPELWDFLNSLLFNGRRRLDQWFQAVTISPTNQALPFQEYYSNPPGASPWPMEDSTGLHLCWSPTW